MRSQSWGVALGVTAGAWERRSRGDVTDGGYRSPGTSRTAPCPPTGLRVRGCRGSPHPAVTLLGGGLGVPQQQQEALAARRQQELEQQRQRERQEALEQQQRLEQLHALRTKDKSRESETGRGGPGGVPRVGGSTECRWELGEISEFGGWRVREAPSGAGCEGCG